MLYTKLGRKWLIPVNFLDLPGLITPDLLGLVSADGNDERKEFPRGKANHTTILTMILNDSTKELTTEADILNYPCVIKAYQLHFYFFRYLWKFHGIPQTCQHPRPTTLLVVANRAIVRDHILSAVRATIRSAYFGRQHNKCAHSSSWPLRPLSERAVVRRYACRC